MLPYKFDSTVWISHSFIAKNNNGGYKVEVGKTKKGSWAHFWIAKSYSKNFQKDAEILRLPAEDFRLIQSNNILLLVERKNYITYRFEILGGYKGTAEAIISWGDKKIILTPLFIMLSKTKYLELGNINLLCYPVLYSPNGKMGSAVGIIISIPKNLSISIPFSRTGQVENGSTRGIVKISKGGFSVYEEI